MLRKYEVCLFMTPAILGARKILLLKFKINESSDTIYVCVQLIADICPSLLCCIMPGQRRTLIAFYDVRRLLSHGFRNRVVVQSRKYTFYKMHKLVLFNVIDISFTSIRFCLPQSAAHRVQRDSTQKVRSQKDHCERAYLPMGGKNSCREGVLVHLDLALHTEIWAIDLLHVWATISLQSL